jgi:polyisoprenoid-binding protein YceI
MKKWLLAVGIAATLSVTAMAADSNVWNFDPAHSAAHFKVKHLGISNVEGNFPKMTGTATLDDKDPSKSSVSATIDVNLVDTGVDARDKDLRSDHFFDVAKFPTMTFQSTKIWKDGDGFKMTGNLTIHGVTKEVTFNVDELTAPVKSNGATHRGASATVKVNRQDYGITYGSPMVGDQITIELDVDLMQK